MTAVIYVRQSRDAAGTGLAVARQLEDCERHAAERGWTVTAVFTDNDTSASSHKPRPAYTEMLAAVEAGEVDTIVCWAIDRLTRKLTDLEHLIEVTEKHHCRLSTVSGDLDLSTDAGRLVGRILASVAKGEVERKGARQRRATLQAAEAGKVPAKRAFGYNLDGTVHEVEGSALREMYGLVVGGMSTLGAMRWLNERGLTTTSGRAWDRSSVRAVIRNPRNAGHRTLRREIVAVGKWEPIVDEATWRAAIETITDASKNGRRNARRWLGGGTYFCHCGSPVKVNYSQHGKRVYQCQASSHMSRSADPVDDMVEKAMVAKLNDGETLGQLLAPVEADIVTPLRDEATGLRLRLDQLGVDYAEDLLTGRQVQVATETIEARLHEVERALAEAARGSRLAPLANSRNPGERWRNMKDLAAKKAALDAVMTVTLLPGSRGRAPFREDSVVIVPSARFLSVST